MTKIFALVDCNNFYVSCERVFDPKLEGKPVVVISSVGGCALARSNEAKKLGVLMGQPYFEWKNIAEQNKMKLFTPNFALYGDLSNRVMKTVSSYSNKSEIYSIDECFLDITDMEINGYESYGIEIKNAVKKSCGIPVSVGIATTKTLAKVANELGKKRPEYNGVVNISETNSLDSILKNIQVEEVWGIGRQTATKLHIADIHTAYDFIKMSGEYVRKTYGIGFYNTWLELQGTHTEHSHHTMVSNKSIMCTRTFANTTSHLENLISHVTEYASLASEKLRDENLIANYVTVFIRTNRFLERDKRYRGEHTIALDEASSYTQDIVSAAIKSLKNIYQKGYEYKKAGVILSGFTHENEKQLSIGNKSNENDQKKKRLMLALDKINWQHGSNTIHLAAQDMKENFLPKAKQNLRSPRYTTKWKELKKVL